MPGAQSHPQPRVQKRKAHELATTGPPNIPAFPARWFYGLLRDLLGDRAFLPPSPAVFRQLEASVEAPGPHDFAVRARRTRLVHRARPSHPAPNVRDDREAPLLRERGMAETSADDLPDAAS